MECLLDNRYLKETGYKPEYLVKWAGYGVEEATWVPLSELVETAKEVVLVRVGVS